MLLLMLLLLLLLLMVLHLGLVPSVPLVSGGLRALGAVVLWAVEVFQ